MKIATTRILNALLGMIVAVLLTRLLGAEGFGIFSYFTILLTMATIPIGRGWGVVLLRSASASHFLGDWRETKGIIARGGQYAIAVAAIFTIIVALYRLQYANQSSAIIGMAVALGVILLFDQLSTLRSQLLRGLEMPVLAVIPELVVRPVSLILFLGIPLFFAGSGLTVEIALLALLGAAFAGLLSGALILRYRMPADLKATPETYQDRLWIGSALRISANATLFVASTYLDILLLGILSTSEDVGIYRIAAQVGAFSGLAYTSLNMIVSQRFACLKSSGDTSKLQSTATLMARVAFGCNFAITIGLAVTAHRLVPYLFGEKFATAALPLVIVAAGQSINAAAGMANTLLTMTGHENCVTRAIGVSIGINAVLCVILIPFFGPVGAAVSALLATLIANVALWVTAWRLLSIDTSIWGAEMHPPASPTSLSQ